VTIRALTSADREALAVFTCARLGEPWAEAVQDAIRNDLADQVASGDVSAMGLFDQGGALCGVAAWRIYDVTLPALCRGDIVAVAVREQRKGYGRALKKAMIAGASVVGAVAVSSVVHRDNTAMINLNRQLGAVVEEIPDDGDHCRCVIGPL
jgi:GNAT superfamily N-acetyltransferase